MYMNDRPEFDRQAKFWTETYAKESSQEEAIDRVCEMGFDRDAARGALETTGWDERLVCRSFCSFLLPPFFLTLFSFSLSSFVRSFVVPP